MSQTARPRLALAGRWAAGALALAAALATGAGGAEVTWEQWLAEVDLLITDAEREVFAGLEHGYQRRAFVEGFWRARDPFPATPHNEFLEQWRLRLALARERFESLDDDRARFLLLAGPPDTILLDACPLMLAIDELWMYDGGGGRPRLSAVFAREGARLRLLPAERLSAEDLLSERTTRRRSAIGTGRLDLERDIQRRCPQGREIQAALATAADWRTLATGPAAPPAPSPEWLATFVERSTEVPADARPLAAHVATSFPSRRGARTAVRVHLTPEDRSPRPQPTAWVIDGEVLRGPELFESFRYRFDGAEGADPPPLLFERHLRPGSYTLVLRLKERRRLESQQDSFFRHVGRLDVPAVTDAAFARQSDAEPPAAPPPPAIPAASPPAVPPPQQPPALEPGVRLLPLPDRLLTGRQRVEALAVGEAVAEVTFLLDRRAVMTKRRPPFSVELDLGEAPRRHQLEVVARDADGRELARDRTTINAGPHRFSVELVEPRAGQSADAGLQISARVNLPQDEVLDRLELYLDETRLATLYQPPFVQPVPAATAAGTSYVRAVAHLADGNSAEDLVFIYSPERSDAIQVDFVELYTSVVDRQGKHVPGLERQEFRVLEDGVEQEVRRFELVRELPIHAAVLIDTSTSMVEEEREAEAAALRFFRRVVRPQDRAAVILFSDAPRLAVPLTNNHEVLAGGLAGMAAEGETALYDSIIYGLYYLAGLRGKRALILLSDGADSISRHSFTDTLQFARRSGVAVYAIGLGLEMRDVDARAALRKLAQETAGESFFIETAKELERIYSRIEEELRTQYLLGYQSSQTVDLGFRAVAVEVARPGLEAKTVPGYYP